MIHCKLPSNISYIVYCFLDFNKELVTWILDFFSIRVFFHGHGQLTGQQGKGGPSFIPFYHFHPLTNIQAFICNFAGETTIPYF